MNMTTLCVCIPTAKRPKIVERLLNNLLQQTRMPDEILLVDGSSDDGTEKISEAWKTKFPPGVLRLIESDLGLSLQRNVGIEHTDKDLICMLDDDVLLEPDCLEKMEKFLCSEEGQSFGVISAFISNEYGKDFYRYHKLYNKLGFYEGELTPGRWLYCGDFLELSTLKPFSGVFLSQFAPAGAAMFRRVVIREIRPDSNFRFGGEDKHLTLRISQKYKIGVLGDAQLVHEHVSSGVRKSRFRQGMQSMRNKAIILKECDSNPTTLRYLTYLFYQPLDLLRMTISFLLVLRWRELDWVWGSWIGWVWNLVAPPQKNIS